MVSSPFELIRMGFLLIVAQRGVVRGVDVAVAVEIAALDAGDLHDHVVDAEPAVRDPRRDRTRSWSYRIRCRSDVPSRASRAPSRPERFRETQSSGTLNAVQTVISTSGVPIVCLTRACRPRNTTVPSAGPLARSCLIVRPPREDIPRVEGNLVFLVRGECSTTLNDEVWKSLAVEGRQQHFVVGETAAHAFGAGIARQLIAKVRRIRVAIAGIEFRRWRRCRCRR